MVTLQSTEKSSIFSYAWMKLSQASGALVADGEVQLPTYKPTSKIEEGKVDTVYLVGMWLRWAPSPSEVPCC